MTKPKSFEEAIKELESIAEKLEKGQLTLEESILAYEKGVELKNLCQAKLKEAESKVEILLKNEKGEVVKKQVKNPASVSDKEELF